MSLLGDYIAIKDVPTQMGLSYFTIPLGAIIAVKQHDKNNKSILVEAGPRDTDWMCTSFLNSFERID